MAENVIFSIDRFYKFPFLTNQQQSNNKRTKPGKFENFSLDFSSEVSISKWRRQVAALTVENE